MRWTSPRGPAAIAAAVLAVSGAALVLRGAWIPAKAWLAQRLIERAWAESLADGTPALPWAWADTWPIARLSLPGASRPLYVLAGASGQSLAFGPAHVSASAPPGSRDNVVLVGHRDTHFAPLADLAIGEEIRLESRDGATRYRIEATAVVHESRIEILERSGRSELTLITCYPFDAILPGGPLRYVVFAREAADRDEVAYSE